MVKVCLNVKEFIQQTISTDADSATHSLSRCTRLHLLQQKFEGTAYVIRLYRRQQLFPMAEKQFLNQDHHKVQDSEGKPCHMPRYSPISAKK